MNLISKSLSPQALKIYSLLNKQRRPLTAKQISKQLKIFPHAVYRSVKQLLDLEFVEEIYKYPIRFQARTPDSTVELYSMIFRQNFQNMFGQRAKPTRLLDLDFIKKRMELIKKVSQDLPDVKNKINIIASGLELPAETIFLYKKAIDRGVKIRVLVQRLDEINRQMLKNWQRIGVEVKYYPNMEARIFVMDERTVYFTSYNPKQKEEATGMRFAYAPYAKLMDELFERRWVLAKTI